MDRTEGNKRGKSLPEIGTSRIEVKMQQQRGSPSLNLADSFVGDDGCEAVVRFLRENSGITALDLRGNGITSAGLAVLSVCLAGRCSLRMISLEWNNIADDFGVFAEALSKNLSLQVIDLRNNRIGQDGAGLLAKVVELNTTIQKIDLRWNEIGVTGGKKFLASLSRPHSIKSLELAGNKIPEELLSAIERAVNSDPDSYPKPESFNSRTEIKPESFVSRAESSKPLTPNKQKEFSYNDELFGKYESLMIHNARYEAKVKELEILLEQESRKVLEVRYELTRDIENEKNRRVQADENFLRFKEEALKKEVESVRTVQDLESRVNKLLSEKNVLAIEYESLQEQFDNFHRQSQDRIRCFEEKVEMQEKQYRLLEENSRRSLEEMRHESDQEKFEIVSEFQQKLAGSEEQVMYLKQVKFELETDIKGLKNQVIQIKSKSEEDLNDLELAIREEESLKYDKMVNNFETRIRSLEESREALNKSSQDQQRDFKFAEKKLLDTISTKESEILSLKSETQDQTKQIQRFISTIDNLRSELSSARHEIEKVNSENDDLNKCIKERKEVFLEQIDQISQEHSREKNFLQDKIDDLSNALQKVEAELARVRRDKDRIVKDHEYLSETLKIKVSNFIHDSVLAHMKKVQEPNN